MLHNVNVSVALGEECPRLLAADVVGHLVLRVGVVNAAYRLHLFASHTLNSVVDGGGGDRFCAKVHFLEGVGKTHYKLIINYEALPRHHQ